MSILTVDRAEMLREAHAVLHVAMEMQGRGPVQAAAVSLDDALDNYAELDAGTLHWAVIWPHLRDEADPDGQALRKAADEVEAAAEDLIGAMARNLAEAAR